MSEKERMFVHRKIEGEIVSDLFRLFVECEKCKDLFVWPHCVDEHQEGPIKWRCDKCWQQIPEEQLDENILLLLPRRKESRRPTS